MSKVMNRPPLRDITTSSRVVNRAVGVIKPIPQKVTTVKVAPTLKCTTFHKVNPTISKPCVRKSISNNNNYNRSNLSTYHCNELMYIPEQPMVNVKNDEIWLCEPSLSKDILSYMKNLENRHILPKDYLMLTGSKITNEMRATLVNWLVEIHGHLKLQAETLHIAIKLLDATLYRYKLSATRLQLCGLAVLWIASKLEYKPVAAQDLLYLMCYKGNVSILTRMEQLVLRILDFQVQVADPVFFLSRLMLYDELGNDEQFFHTCTYCLDSVLYDVSIVEIPSSELASSALLAGRLIYDRTDWPLALGYATGHWPKPNKLRYLALKMILAIIQAFNGTSGYTGAWKKYASRKKYACLSKDEKFSIENLNHVVNLLSL